MRHRGHYDRRRGSPPVSRLQFWLGIAGSLATLSAMFFSLTIKATQWTETVNMNIQQLTKAVGSLETVTTTLVTDHAQIKSDERDTNTRLENLKEQVQRRVPVFAHGKGLD